MRHFASFRIVAAAILVLFVAGCSTAGLDTPTKKLAAAKSLYTEVLDVASALVENGKLTNSQILTIDAARQGVRASIDTAEALIAADDPTAAFYIEQAAEIARVFADVVYKLRARQPVAYFLEPPGIRSRPVVLSNAAITLGSQPW